MFKALKNKITIGLAFLFALLLLSSGIGIYNIYTLRKEAKGMIQANYETLNYCQGISVLLDSLPSQNITAKIESLIKLQQNNITEVGEKKATENLIKDWDSLKQLNYSKDFFAIHRDLNLIEQLNMQAIERKNIAAEKTADKVLFVITVISILFLALAIPFVIKFPAYIAVPVIKRDKDKTNFLATISHELKTPLSSTDIALKLLSNEKIGSLNKEQQQLVNDLKGENQRLIKLVSELLDLSQAETGNINLNIMPVSVLDMVTYSTEALKAPLQEKKLHIQCIDINAKQFIKADKEKASWVLINILSNAIRFSPEASSIIIQASNQQNGLLTLSVQDKGAGIPKAFQKNLFQRFYKIPIPSSSKGTGLGLSIAKEFMDAMNGKIYLDTNYTLGAKFNLEFVLED